MKRKYHGWLKISAVIIQFLIVFTVVTLFFYPKWKADTEKNPSAGLYYEEPNSIDVLLLGSCNIYTSFSPNLFYEEYGITSYCRSCPDQTYLTSYYYLKESLKTQKPKVVVLESLFLTNPDTYKREFYNRYAVDYMRPSIEKLELCYYLARTEGPVLESFGEQPPDFLTRFAGYLFPLLRYHARDDINILKDAGFFLLKSPYSHFKGSVPFFTYVNVDGLDYPIVKNNNAIREDVKIYLPKIQQLCEENGIPLVIVKSPNRWRWNEEITAVAKEYVTSCDLPFVDIDDGSFGTYPEYYYQDHTGRLNIYGMREMTHYFGKYLVDNYGLTPTVLKEKSAKRWEECVSYLYEKAKEKNMDLTRGEIAQLRCDEGGILVRWNPYVDCDTYSVLRSINGSTEEEIAQVAGSMFIDCDNTSGELTTYRVVPVYGEHAGIASAPKQYRFVDTPSSFSAVKEGDSVKLSWDSTEGATGYILQQMQDSYRFTDLAETTDCIYIASGETAGEFGRYRLRAVLEADGETYYSDGIVVSIQ